MATKTDICNLALTRIGATPIADFTEDSTEADYCRRLYDPARKAALRAFPWNFAVTTADLAAVTALPGFTGAFTLPSDCVRALAPVSTDYVPFEIRGKTLLADAETVTLKYLQNVTDTAVFDDQFVEALSFRLAVDLAIPLTGKADRQAGLLRLYANALKAAQQSDAQEQRRTDTAGQSILESRA
ncbi:MAG: hypothetical protein WCS70_06760 [Verrucomicrobiota bacterium]